MPDNMRHFLEYFQKLQSEVLKEQPDFERIQEYAGICRIAIDSIETREISQQFLHLQNQCELFHFAGGDAAELIRSFVIRLRDIERLLAPFHRI